MNIRNIVLLIVLPFLLFRCIPSQRQSRKMYEKAILQKPFDAIIVPGCPYDSADGKWSDLMRIRVYWAFFLYQNGVAKNVIFSGSAVYTPYVESKIMALYAEKMGISREHIFMETQAEHSTENLYYSYYMGTRLGFSKIALASDPFQVKLLKRFSKKTKVPTVPIPMVFQIVKNMQVPTIAIEPDSAKSDKNFIALPLREKFWKRFRGTLGKNLKVDPDDIRFVQKKPK